MLRMFLVSGRGGRADALRKAVCFPAGVGEPGPPGAGGAAGSPLDEQTGRGRAEGGRQDGFQRNADQDSVQPVRSSRSTVCHGG